MSELDKALARWLEAMEDQRDPTLLTTPPFPWQRGFDRLPKTLHWPPTEDEVALIQSINAETSHAE